MKRILWPLFSPTSHFRLRTFMPILRQQNFQNQWDVKHLEIVYFLAILHASHAAHVSLFNNGIFHILCLRNFISMPIFKATREDDNAFPYVRT